MTTFVTELIVTAIVIWFASSFEWTLHRFIMHKPLGKFRYPYEAHALLHHRIFKADETYHLLNEDDKWTIPMAWWNGPALIAVGTLMTLPFSIILQMWSISVTSFIVFTLYYGAYEYLHWCMHLPKKRIVERNGLFFRLNGHHLLHHRYMNKNFNVVLPLADFLYGTLLLRSKIIFKQAQGPTVPNVQPIQMGNA